MPAIITIISTSVLLASVFVGASFLNNTLQTSAAAPTVYEAVITEIPQVMSSAEEPTQITETENPASENSSVSLPVSFGFGGDIMLDRGVLRSVEKNFDDDFDALFQNLSLIKDFDIFFANLEGPVSDKGKNVGSKWSFRMKPEVAEVLARAGIDIVSLANNHMGDWTLEALIDTLNYLQKAGVNYAGASTDKKTATEPTIIEKNGLKIGFLGFSDVGPNWIEVKENSPGVLIIGEDFEEIIKNAAEKVDALIVSVHWGVEYKTKSNERQKKIAHEAIDAGAKLVIGHHPHVMQELEKYNDGLIAYSLGNFIFDQYFSEETLRGKLLELKIVRNPFTQKIEVTDVEEKVVLLNKFFQPEKVIAARDVKPILKKEKKDENPCPKGNDEDDLLLFKVNLENEVGDYIPSDLVLFEKNICLRKVALESLKEMQKSAGKEGLSLIPTSGFRDKVWQKALFDRWQKANVAAVIKAVAPPKHSEHQLGTAIDLTTSSIESVSASEFFENTPEYKWLLNNADKFGFVLSYPKDKEKITGYKFEPWHWRYVGEETAVKIKTSGLTPTEFLP